VSRWEGKLWLGQRDSCEGRADHAMGTTESMTKGTWLTGAMDPSVMYRARRMAHSSLAPSAPLMGEVANPLPRIWHLKWPAQGHLKRTPFATISASLKPIA
jgi:hypothetical protein